MFPVQQAVPRPKRGRGLVVVGVIVVVVGIAITAGVVASRNDNNEMASHEAPSGSAEPAAAVAPVPPAPPPPAPPTPPAPAAPAAPAAPPAPPAPVGDEPPLSSDVLPRDEATPKTRVVIGDGFRFQIPQDFQRVDRANGQAAYAGTVEGFASSTTMTFWAASEPFAGTLDALVDREVRAATAANATAPQVGPVLLQLAGDIKQNYARRLTIEFSDRFELRTVTVHQGKAYIHHCETPNVPNAWANVGSDCLARGTTFHVAPPALEPKSPAAASSAGPPPVTPGVVFLMSKVEGSARPKKAVNTWLDDFAPFIKPCLRDGESGAVWKVTFELGKDGHGRASSVTGGVSDGPDKPSASSVASCVAQAVAQAKIDGVAKGSVKVTAVFSMQ
jgi:hypothetical protein